MYVHGYVCTHIHAHSHVHTKHVHTKRTTYAPKQQVPLLRTHLIQDKEWHTIAARQQSNVLSPAYERVQLQRRIAAMSDELEAMRVLSDIQATVGV